MKQLCILFLCFFAFGCEVRSPHRPSEKERTLNAVIKKAAKQISTETDLIPCGTGGGALNQIRMLALSFDCRRELDIESGRELLVRAMGIFEEIINSDEPIRPHLILYPFPPKNIEIRIFIQRKDGSGFGADKLSVISLIDGILKYKIDSQTNLRFEIIHEETYEKALEKLKEQEVVCL